MTWINIKKRSPPSLGTHTVVVRNDGTKEMAFFKPSPPYSSIKHLTYRIFLSLEEEKSDRCVYVKYKSFDDGYGNEEKNVTHWYELDPIPEDGE